MSFDGGNAGASLLEARRERVDPKNFPLWPLRRFNRNIVLNWILAAVQGCGDSIWNGTVLAAFIVRSAKNKPKDLPTTAIPMAALCPEAEIKRFASLQYETTGSSEVYLHTGPSNLPSCKPMPGQKGNSYVGYVEAAQGMVMLIVALPIGWLADKTSNRYTNRDILERINGRRP